MARSSFPIWGYGVLAALAVAGAAAWFVTAGSLKQAREDIKKQSQKMADLAGSQAYMPTVQNMDTLEANLGALHQVIDPVITRALLPSAQRIAQAAQKNPQQWKSDVLDPAVEKLTEHAKNRGVALRSDFSFGFNRYARSGPTADALPIVAKQLYAIDHAANLLLDAAQDGAVTRLDAVRRTFDDDGVPDEPEMLPGRAQVGGPGYNRYPIEIDFTGNTAGLRNFLNAVAKSPDLFLIRAVQLSNSRPDSPRIPQGGSLKGPDIVLGNDTLQARVWLDLVEWTGAPGKSTAAQAAHPSSTGQEN